jgi:hypothetical protein
MQTHGKQPRLHPKWGYDLDKVPEKLCLICEKPIGDEGYEEVTMCARFGQMLFRHKKCTEGERSSVPWKGQRRRGLVN